MIKHPFGAPIRTGVGSDAVPSRLRRGERHGLTGGGRARGHLKRRLEPFPARLSPPERPAVRPPDVAGLTGFLKPELALTERGRVIAAGERFGAVLVEARYGISAALRQALLH